MVIAGGGTGGHLFPALALADEFKKRDAKAEITFVGSSRGIESRVVPSLGYKLELLDVEGIKRRSSARKFRALIKAVAATLKAAKLIKAIRPDGVIGTGGYCSGPVVLAARLLGIKTAILEQNAVPGLTNRILGRFVHRVYTSFEEAGSYFPQKKIVLAGNPVRKEILGVKREVRSYQDRQFSIFVFGGSQGATAINAAFLDATEHLADIWPSLKVTHQAGYNGFAQVKEAYERKGIKVELHKFINDMAAAYKDCDLIICRAGATSLAEIMAVEMPSILVPYPFSSDSHQDANAKALVDKGAAIMLKQDELTGKTLANAIRRLFKDPEQIKSMRQKVGAMAKGDASADIVDDYMMLLAQ